MEEQRLGLFNIYIIEGYETKLGEYVLFFIFSGPQQVVVTLETRDNRNLRNIFIERTVTSFHSILGGIIPMNKLSVYYRMKFSENNRFPW